MKALSRDFDFPRKRELTIPMYAGGLRLLTFGAFLTASLRAIAAS